MDLKMSLKNFIEQELLADGTEVANDDNLLEDGMIDSLGMLRLAAFIEEAHGVKIDPGDFTIDNFRSIDVIAAYFDSLMARDSANIV
jgi:acyl carrier protein